MKETDMIVTKWITPFLLKMKINRINRRPTTRRSPSRRYEARASSSLGWVSLFSGIFIGIAGTIFLYTTFFENSSLSKIKTLVQKEVKNELQHEMNHSNPPLVLQSSATHEQHPQQIQQTHQAPAKTEPPKPKILMVQNSQRPENEKPKKYEFYNLLPGMEVQLPEQQLQQQLQQQQLQQQQKVQGEANAVQQNQNPVSNQRVRPLQNQLTATHNIPNTETLGIVQKPMVQKPRGQSYGPARRPAPSSQIQAKSNKPIIPQGKKPAPTIPAPTTTLSPRVETKLAAAHYIIQAGIFALPNDATELNSRLNTKGFKPRIQKMKNREGVTAYRVMLGPYSTEAMAVNQKKLLEQNKIHGILILKQS